MTIQLKRGSNGNATSIAHQRQPIKKEVAVPQQAKTLSHSEIAIRAYAIWQKNGYQHGRHQQDWLQAEHELTQLFGHK